MAKAKKLPSGNWRVQVFAGMVNGKRKYRSFTASTKKQAEYLAAEFAAGKNAENDGVVTIRQAVEEYISSKANILSPSTLEGYNVILKNRIGLITDIPVNSFTSVDAQKYINALSGENSPKTVRNTWGLIVSAIAMQQPDKRLFVTLPAPKKAIKELPTPQQVMMAIKGTSVELPALLAMWLSLRMSEVRGIKYGDIKNGILTIQRVKLNVNGSDVVREQTKTYESTRRIKLPPYLLELIGEGEPEEFIVTQAKTTIYKQFVKHIEKAGIPHLRFHDLRHLNASIMLQLGIPEKYAMERGGWSTNSTLQNVYQHTFSTERQLVDKKINDYFEALIK